MKNAEWRMANEGNEATRQPVADAGKTAHYMLRWESARGETGPWSETASATIGA